MLLSLNLIDLFLECPNEPNRAPLFAEILTLQGFEVESTAVFGESYKTVLVGNITGIDKHPQSEKLQVCQVNIGSETLQIVCGATNARLGLVVAVATQGTTINSTTIQPTTLRGVQSNGMLCSRSELGMNDFVDGIWELNADLKHVVLGAPVFDAMGLTDIILDVSVTPNRPDMLCHQSVARELYAGLRRRGKAVALKPFGFLDAAQKLLPSGAKGLKQQIATRSAIGFATAFQAQNDLAIPAFFVGIQNIKVTDSTPWIVNALLALGQKPINNIVDASNLILILFGQPSHAFDHDKISGELRLRNAVQGEKFLGLDNKEYVLTADDCVVADSISPQALLGVIGGAAAAVTKETKNIVLEFANPSAVGVRRSSRLHGRRTDSSFAFEKGIDAWQRVEAACQLLGSLMMQDSLNAKGFLGACHSASSAGAPCFLAEEYDVESKNKSIAYSGCAKILGFEPLPFAQQLEVLADLGFEIHDKSGLHANVKVPSWRSHDIAGPEDLVEEVIRVVGVDKVPSVPLPFVGVLNPDDRHFNTLEVVAACAVKLGYCETAGFHVMGDNALSRLGFPHASALGVPVRILNPIQQDDSCLQTTLLTNLIHCVSENLRHGASSGMLCHIARTFQDADSSGQPLFSKETTDNSVLFEYSSTLAFPYVTDRRRPSETPRCAGVIFGSKEDKHWMNASPLNWSIYDAMAHVAELCRVADCEVNFVPLLKQHPWANALHPNRCVSVMSGSQPLGWLGQFHPRILRDHDIHTAVFGFEINIAQLIAGRLVASAPKRKVIPSQRFQKIVRDFSFVVSNSVNAAAIDSCVASAVRAKQQQRISVDVRIFDIYTGAGVPDGSKSVTLALSLIPLEKTFSDIEISEIYDAVVDRSLIEFGGSIRG